MNTTAATYKLENPITAGEFADAFSSVLGQEGHIQLNDTDNDGLFDTVHTDLNRWELAIELDKLAAIHPQAARLQTDLTGANHIPQLPDPQYTDIDLTGDADIGIGQGEAVFVSANSPHTIAASNAAGPCLIVAIRDPITQTTYLAHIDVDSSFLSVDQAVNQLRQGRPRALLFAVPMEMTVVGGNGATSRAADFLEHMTKHADVDLHAADIGHNPIKGHELAIDTVTGQIDPTANSHDIEFGVDRFKATHLYFYDAPRMPDGARALRVIDPSNPPRSDHMFDWENGF